MAATRHSGHNTEDRPAAATADVSTSKQRHAGRPVAALWDALELADCRPRGRVERFMACCPSHDDHDPSLSVTEGDDGRALVHCFAGCEVDAVLAALGLSVTDLFERASA